MFRYDYSNDMPMIEAINDISLIFVDDLNQENEFFEMFNDVKQIYKQDTEGYFENIGYKFEIILNMGANPNSSFKHTFQASCYKKDDFNKTINACKRFLRRVVKDNLGISQAVQLGWERRRLDRALRNVEPTTKPRKMRL